VSRPTDFQIAEALGIDVRQVSQLHKRGMPVAKLKKARRWFEEHGFKHADRTHTRGGLRGGRT
jgi:hypothetical protein